MRIVIDSNQLQSDLLENFLSKSPSNQAILTDFVAMEAYKGDTLKSIFKSMEIVSRHPEQIIILKGSRKNFFSSGKRKGLQRRLIDEKQTNDFPKYVKALRLAESGNTNFINQILDNGRFADEHFAKMLSEAESMRQIFDKLGKEYSKEEREILRDRKSYTPEMADKIAHKVVDLCGLMYKDSPFTKSVTSPKDLPNTYLFRVTLACYLLGITRAAYGGVENIRPDRLRNDLVDMTLVAYGTYFDGILSNDDFLNKMHSEVCLLLSALFHADVPCMKHMNEK